MEEKEGLIVEHTEAWYEELAAKAVADALAEDGLISPCFIQRRYSVGYGIAIRVLDLLKAKGCIRRRIFKRYEYRAVRSYR